MARQNNLLQLTGSMHNVVHYKRNGKYFSRSKSVVLQQSENSKRASTEFGRASAAAARLSKAFHPLLKLVPHTNHYTRLTGLFTKMIHSGLAEKKGKRIITDGNPSLLKDFSFNHTHSIQQVLKGVQPSIRIEAGESIHFDLPSFYPQEACIEKKNANSIRIEIICFLSDFLLDDGLVIRFDELDLALENKPFEGGSVHIPLKDAENKLVIWGMCVHYLDSHKKPYNHYKFSAFDIVDALLIKNGAKVLFAESPANSSQPLTEKVDRMPWSFKQVG